MNVPTTASEDIETRPCPCGNGLPYRRCCGIYHRGEAPAPTAEALMRSRYTAFALGGLGDYLVRTWEADAIDPALTAEQLDRQEQQWLRLEILDAHENGAKATVEFKAHCRPFGAGPAATPQVLHERSRFRRRQGLWRYVDGIIDPPPAATASRNAPCLCGSGKKAKRCCLR